MKNSALYNDIKDRLDLYRSTVDLPGLDNPQAEKNFIGQFIDSHKRIEYIRVLRNRDLDEERKNPKSTLYDPLRAAILFSREGNNNEAVWNLLLYVHFGKNLKSNYGLCKAVYGKLGDEEIWDWVNINMDLNGFKLWLDENIAEIKSHGAFGNHRKYQSLKIDAKSGTYQTFESFLSIVDHDFDNFINSIPLSIRENKNLFFNYLFTRFVNIVGFGRLAVFDFLCMIGKVGIVDIEPEHPYLGNSGPVDGTKLLFDSDSKIKDLNDYLTDLGRSFSNYPFVMQILEDCVCNWQKSPTRYKLFRG